MFEPPRPHSQVGAWERANYQVICRAILYVRTTKTKMQKIYIETSIISYLTARPSSNLIAAAWQKETLDWWETQRNRFDLYISNIVKEEAGRGDSGAASRRLEALASIPILPIYEDVVKLSKALIQEGGLPQKPWMMLCILL